MRTSPGLKPLVSLTRLLIALSFVLILAKSAGAEADRITVVDGAGRSLQIAASIKRVYATNPTGVMMLYSLAPEKMVAWNYPLSAVEKHFLLPSVRELPALGGWFGENGKGNPETILASRPDIILSIGNRDRTAIEFAERLQQQLGIPVFIASGMLVDTADTYERLGALLGTPERAKLLADYSRRTLADTKVFAEALSEKEKVRLYYAEGLRGLQTDTRGSLHVETLDLVGVENVANGPASNGYGRVSVSLDQVIAWHPDAMLICPEKNPLSVSWRPEWLDNPSWRQVPAVAQGRVYLIPGSPFNWLDRPPSAARMLGLKWLAWVLYPERIHFDMIAETREFFRLFYQYDLGEDEARQILKASKPTIAKP